MEEQKQYLKELKVLYVEDDAQTLQLYSSFLKYYVKEIYTCDNAFDALKVFEKNSFDVIISDIEMPKMNGIEMVEKIRQKDKNVRIIMLTAYTDAKYTIPSIELDITRYLVKPVSKTAIFEALLKCYEQLHSNKDIITLAKDTQYYIKSKELRIKDQHIKLQKKPLLLLDILVKAQGKTLPYEDIAKSISSEEPLSMNAIRCHMRLLRKTVPSLKIANISGVGYKLEP